MIALEIRHSSDGYWLHMGDPETDTFGALHLQSRVPIVSELLAKAARDTDERDTGKPIPLEESR